MDPGKIMLLILLAPGAILAIALHEAMHGYVAHRLGDPTAKLMGRLTLNPFKHIDLIGTILVPALLFYTSGLLFGWAKPVPVNIQNLNRPKRDMALVAAAGPGSNLALAVIASLALYALGPLTQLSIPISVLRTVLVPLILILFFMVKFNLMLMLFNLIPIPPLDGGRILIGILPLDLARAVARIEPFGFFILIGILLIDNQVPILDYSLRPAMNLLEQILMPGYVEAIIRGV